MQTRKRIFADLNLHETVALASLPLQINTHFRARDHQSIPSLDRIRRKGLRCEYETLAPTVCSGL